MRISDAADLGATIRSHRGRLGLTQAELATKAHVSRRWLSDVEAGKESAEFGLVLRTLRALDLMVDLTVQTRTHNIDLDAYLERFREPLP